MQRRRGNVAFGNGEKRNTPLAGEDKAKKMWEAKIGTIRDEE